MSTVDPRTWAAPKPAGLRRYVPILTWLPAYDWGLLRFDLIAGATIWGLLVPEMIAYAGLAGLTPQAGLYTLLVTLTAYAIFGTSRHLVVAGTSAGGVLVGSSVADRHPGSPEEYATLAAGLILIAGIVFLLAGFLRLGFIAQFLSVPVIEGFVFGLAIFVTVSQAPKLFGIEKGGGDTVRQFLHLLGHLGDTSGTTLVIGAGALVLLFGVERLAPALPGGLIALVLGIAVSAAFDLVNHGVAVVGEVPSGLPSVAIPHIARDDLFALMAAAAGLVLVIFSESLGAAKTFATKYGYEIDSNQELIALGVANSSSALVGGLAGGGSLSQTAVNEGAGARSEMSPIVASLLAVVTILFLTPLFKDLPEAVLAALIIHAVSHLMKVKAFREYYAEQRPEFWLGLLTLVGVITLDVLPGLVIGAVSMVLLVVYHASRPHLGVLGAVPDADGAYGDVTRHPDYRQVPGLLILRLEAPLFYANASLVRDHVKTLVGAADPTPYGVILDAGANGDQLDVTAAQTLTALVEELHAAGIDVALAEIRQPVVEMARRSGLSDALGEARILRTIHEAVEALRR